MLTKTRLMLNGVFFLNKTKLLPKLLSSLFENHLLNFFLHHVLPEANC